MEPEEGMVPQNVASSPVSLGRRTNMKAALLAALLFFLANPLCAQRETGAGVSIPVLSYSTYLGGSSLDAGNAVALDSAGNLYVAGSTVSDDFPGSLGMGGYDVFVARFAADGTLAYSVRLGGSSDDFANGVSVDPSGNVYVTGSTASADLEVTADAFQTRLQGTSNAFVVELDPSGALLYSTYLGGSSADSGGTISNQGPAHVLVGGTANSKNFPVTAGAFQPSSGGSADAFISLFDLTKAGASALLYSTYLGGADNDGTTGVRLDNAGQVYVGGFSESGDFPTTASGFQRNNGGFFCSGEFCYDSFFAKLDPMQSGSASLLYSTYLGGSLSDWGFALEIDASGHAFLLGQTAATDFPVTSGALQKNSGGNMDTFIGEIDPSASGAASLLYATYLGGAGADFGTGIGLDSVGNIYAAGGTYSEDFPMLNAVQGSCASCKGGFGTKDVFLSKIAAGGRTLVSSTYLGGEKDDLALALAVNAAGSVALTGETFSFLFPVTAGAFDGKCGTDSRCNFGKSDVLLTKLDQSTQPDFSIASSPLLTSVKAGRTATYRLTLSSLADFAGTVKLGCAGSPAQSQCTISPASVMLQPLGSATTTVTVTTSPSTPKDKYNLRLRGSTPAFSRHFRVLLAVK